jgi:radical SAM protein with 4Fe4S-binding SPASM domain
VNQSPKIYQKDCSFIEIRHDNQDREAVLARIRRLEMDGGNRQVSDSVSHILRQVYDDILGTLSSEAEHRFHLKDYIVEEIRKISDRDLPRYLTYRYRYDIFPKKKIVDDFPPCLQIEPTSICNYRCVFCYQTDKELTDPKNGYMGVMSLGLFTTVIDQAEGKCEAVTLSSRGEPLMNRNIDQMLAYASGKFLGLKLNTNAWFLDERKSHAILQAGCNTVVFSADAASEPLYSQLRVHGKLERVIANVRRFQEIRRRHYSDSQTITRVSGVKFSDAQNLDEVEALWGDLVDQVAFVDYNPWENTYQRPVNNIVTPCSDLWRRMFVWYDGTVNPCDVDYKSTLTVGNANTERVSDIWTGEEYSALRTAHLNSRRSTVSPCNRCTLV